MMTPIRTVTFDQERAVYIVVRADLNMPRGKEIAQAIHAWNAMEADAQNYANQYNSPVICLRAESEQDLRLMLAEAVISDEWVATVVDAGRTVVEPGTLTCIVIGPTIRERDAGHLPLLDAARPY